MVQTVFIVHRFEITIIFPMKERMILYQNAFLVYLHYPSHITDPEER